MSPSFRLTDTAAISTYTLSLHDALPISGARATGHRETVWPRHPDVGPGQVHRRLGDGPCVAVAAPSVEPAQRRGRLRRRMRSEEHTSELQSHSDLVCRLLLEKKKKKKKQEKQRNRTEHASTH